MPDNVSEQVRPAEKSDLQKAGQFLYYLRASLGDKLPPEKRPEFKIDTFLKGSRHLQQFEIDGIRAIDTEQAQNTFHSLGRDKRVWNGVFDQIVDTANLIQRSKGNPTDLKKVLKSYLGVAVTLGMDQKQDDPELQDAKDIIEVLIEAYGAEGLEDEPTTESIHPAHVTEKGRLGLLGRSLGKLGDFYRFWVPGSEPGNTEEQQFRPLANFKEYQRVADEFVDLEDQLAALDPHNRKYAATKAKLTAELDQRESLLDQADQANPKWNRQYNDYQRQQAESATEDSVDEDELTLEDFRYYKENEEIPEEIEDEEDFITIAYRKNALVEMFDDLDPNNPNYDQVCNQLEAEIKYFDSLLEEADQQHPDWYDILEERQSIPPLSEQALDAWNLKQFTTALTKSKGLVDDRGTLWEVDELMDLIDYITDDPTILAEVVPPIPDFQDKLVELLETAQHQPATRRSPDRRTTSVKAGEQLQHLDQPIFTREGLLEKYQAINAEITRRAKITGEKVEAPYTDKELGRYIKDLTSLTPRGLETLVRDTLAKRFANKKDRGTREPDEGSRIKAIELLERIREIPGAEELTWASVAQAVIDKHESPQSQVDLAYEITQRFIDLDTRYQLLTHSLTGLINKEDDKSPDTELRTREQAQEIIADVAQITGDDQTNAVKYLESVLYTRINETFDRDNFQKAAEELYEAYQYYREHNAVLPKFEERALKGNYVKIHDGLTKLLTEFYQKRDHLPLKDAVDQAYSLIDQESVPYLNRIKQSQGQAAVYQAGIDYLTAWLEQAKKTGDPTIAPPLPKIRSTSPAAATTADTQSTTATTPELVAEQKGRLSQADLDEQAAIISTIIFDYAENNIGTDQVQREIADIFREIDTQDAVSLLVDKGLREAYDLKFLLSGLTARERAKITNAIAARKTGDKSAKPIQLATITESTRAKESPLEPEAPEIMPIEPIETSQTSPEQIITQEADKIRQLIKEEKPFLEERLQEPAEKIARTLSEMDDPVETARIWRNQDNSVLLTVGPILLRLSADRYRLIQTINTAIREALVNSKQQPENGESEEVTAEDLNHSYKDAAEELQEEEYLF